MFHFSNFKHSSVLILIETDGRSRVWIWYMMGACYRRLPIISKSQEWEGHSKVEVAGRKGEASLWKDGVTAALSWSLIFLQVGYQTHPTKLDMAFPFIQLGTVIEKKGVGVFGQQSSASHLSSLEFVVNLPNCLVKMWIIGSWGERSRLFIKGDLINRNLFVPDTPFPAWQNRSFWKSLWSFQVPSFVPRFFAFCTGSILTISAT